MARTTEMRLIELMVLKQDVLNVIEYLGKTGKFQFQSNKKSSSIESEEKSENIDAEFFDNLQKVRNFLGIDDRETGVLSCERATDEDRNTASKLISLVSDIEKRVSDKIDDIKRISDSYKEAQASGQILNYICIVPIFMTYLEFKMTSAYYLIPICNVSQILTELFTKSVDPINLIITNHEKILNFRYQHDAAISGFFCLR